MRRRALLVAFILIVAAPDCAAVLIRAVLDFTAIKGAAVTAYDARGKTAFAAVASFQTSPPLQFHLGQIEYLRADNGWMAVLRVILRDLVAIVHHEGFLDIVRAVGLLQDASPLYFSLVRMLSIVDGLQQAVFFLALAASISFSPSRLLREGQGISAAFSSLAMIAGVEPSRNRRKMVRILLRCEQCLWGNRKPCVPASGAGEDRSS